MVDILRRGRLSVHDDEMIKYTSSMDADKYIFDADILVDLAHTIMLKEQGIIKEDICKDILKGLIAIQSQGIEILDATQEDIHISLESKLIEMVGEDIGGRMHSGRSRNDEVATCIRIALREELIHLIIDLINLCKVLQKIAENNIETIMPGFTHLQHAQPTTLAHHMMAHAGAFMRDISRLFDAYNRVNLSPLGSAAFASTGFNVDRNRTKELLGFDGLIENSMDAVSSRDFLIETASAFSNIMINLSKMAEEIIIWSTTEFNFIEIDDKYASTSSIMPQKKNPDTAELIRGKCGVVVGSLSALFITCKGLPLSYNRDLQEATPNIWRSIETTRASVRIMAKMIETMKVKKEVMLHQSAFGFTTATELADCFVREANIPFRTAHQIVGVLAQKSTDGKDIGLCEIDSVSLKIIGKKLSECGLTESIVKNALDPMQNIINRTVIGGPAPSTMENAIQNKIFELFEYENRVNKLQENIEDAFEKLDDAVLKICDKL